MPSIENWKTQTMRLTIFPSMEKEMVKLAGWEAIVGDPPDQITQQPKSNILEELGKFGNGTLSHRVIPGRVDWNYVPLISEDKMMAGLPDIGSFTEALGEFKPLMIKWLDQCDDLNRIAFGANIVLPVESHEIAYELLNNLLKSVKLDPETSDFKYQINRKRPSKSLGEQLMINRLSKWRAIRFKLMVQEMEAVESFACALEFDINNVPMEQTTIKKDSLTDVFCELIDLGIEIACEGDIP